MGPKSLRRNALRRGVLLALAGCFGLLQWSAAAMTVDAAPTCDDHFRDAQMAVRERFYDDARVAYEKVVECEGKASRRVSYSLARVYLQLGRYDEAQQHATAAVKKAELERADRPEALEASLNLLGNVLADRARWTVESLVAEERSKLLLASERTFRRAVELSSSRSRLKSATRNVPWYNLAAVMAAQGRYGEARVAAGEYLGREENGPFAEPALSLISCAERLAGSPDSEPQSTGGIVPAPKIRSRVEPIVPPSLPGPIKESVSLEVVIDRCGSLRSLVVQGSPAHGVAVAASRAIRQWKFDAVELDGDPIVVRHTLNVTLSSRTTDAR